MHMESIHCTYHGYLQTKDRLVWSKTYRCKMQICCWKNVYLFLFSTVWWLVVGLLVIANYPELPWVAQPPLQNIKQSSPLNLLQLVPSSSDRSRNHPHGAFHNAISCKISNDHCYFKSPHDYESTVIYGIWDQMTLYEAITIEWKRVI